MSFTVIKKINIGALAALSASLLWAAPAPLGSYQTTWGGRFGDQTIGVFIQSLDARQIRGYSVVGALQRPFQGSVKMNGAVYLVTAEEPKDVASDGTFRFVVDPQFPQRITATWVSQSPKIADKHFELNRRSCAAGAQMKDYFADKKLFKGKDLQQSAWDLQLMRNEIYARHGYAFKDKELAVIFAEQPWYVPCYRDVSAKLNKIELQNIQRLKKAQEYAALSDWGR